MGRWADGRSDRTVPSVGRLTRIENVGLFETEICRRRLIVEVSHQTRYAEITIIFLRFEYLLASKCSVARRFDPLRDRFRGVGQIALNTSIFL